MSAETRCQCSFPSPGQRTDYQYDQYGDLTAVLLPAVPDPRVVIPGSQPVRPTYHYDYDQYGQLLHVRDPLSQQDLDGAWTRQTTFAYDHLGRKIGHTLPMGQTESWTHTPPGQLESHTDFLGQKATYDYDGLGRVWHKKLHAAPDPFDPGAPPTLVKTVTYAYDQYDADGNRHDTVTIGAAVTDSAYDREGRLIALASPEGAVHYEYDPATGQQVRVWTGADLATATTDVHYEHDELGRLTSVQAARLDGSAVSLTTTYAYDVADRLTTTTFPNGTTETRSYDDLNRLTSIVTTLTANPNQVLAGFTYTLDADGHRVAVDEATGRHVAYTYDADGRLTREAITNDPTAPDRTLDYIYDLAGNRVVTRDSAATDDTSYSHDDDDRLTELAIGMSRTEYGYDDNGALTTVDGTLTYTYDLEGRLVHADTNGHSVDFTYDDAGHRTSQTVDGQTTTYLNDPSQAYDQVLEEYAPNGVLAATYVRGLDLIFQDRAGARSYYVKDGLGSTRALTDANGSVTDTYTYDAYGVATHFGTTINTRQFAGYERDESTGLNNLQARYYDADMARFTSRDSYMGRPADPITQNHYLYAGANPVDNIDPSGHDSLGISIALGGLNGLSSLQTTSTQSFSGSQAPSVIGDDSGDIDNLIDSLNLESELQLSQVRGAMQTGIGLAATASRYAFEMIDFLQDNLPFDDPTRLALAWVGARACFAAGTRVIVATGDDGDLDTRPIEEIVEGDFVLSRDQHSPDQCPRPRQVVKTYTRLSSHVRELTARDSDGREITIRTTDEHPFWVKGRGWSVASRILPGDHLYGLESGSDAVVVGSRHTVAEGGTPVYNLEVAEDHTYFISDPSGLTPLSLWVHNLCLYDSVQDKNEERRGHSDSSTLPGSFG